MNNIKVWPHMTIVAVLCALIAGLGVAFYLKHEQTALAAEMPNAARIERIDGQVAFNDALYSNDPNGQTNTQWVAAMPNQIREPLRDNGHVQDTLDSLFEVQERLFRWRYPDWEDWDPDGEEYGQAAG